MGVTLGDALGVGVGSTEDSFKSHREMTSKPEIEFVFSFNSSTPLPPPLPPPPPPPSPLADFTVRTEEFDLLASSVGVASPPEGLELTEGLEASLTPESASSEEEGPSKTLRGDDPSPAPDEGVEGPR